MSIVAARKRSKHKKVMEGSSMFNKSNKKLVLVLAIVLALGMAGTVLANQDKSEQIRLSSATSALVFQTDSACKMTLLPL